MLPLVLLLLNAPSHVYVQCDNLGHHVPCPPSPVIIVLPVDSRACARRNKNPILGSRIWSSPSELFNLLAEDNDGHPMRIPHCGDVSLSCWAPQPITWNYDGNLSSLKVKSIKVTRVVSDPHDSSSFCYNAILTLTMYRQFFGTGKYTCSMLTKPINSRVGVEELEDDTHPSNPTSKSLYLFRN
ncbi:unnamed protein product, partial [Allacma fusca]